MVITLEGMRTMVRQRTGFEAVTLGGTDSLVSDVELTSYLNSSLAELHDKLVLAFEEYFTLSTTVTVAAGANTITPPDNFYKVRRLQYQSGTRWTRVPRFEMDEIEQGDGAVARLSTWRAYRMLGTTIFLLPEDSADGTYRLWYIRGMTELSAAEDEWTDPGRWWEYAVVDVCIKCLLKEESDATAFIMQKQALSARIDAAAANRDAGSPGRVADVRWQRDRESDGSSWGDP